MPIHSVHERPLPLPPEAVGALLGGLASEDDRLWPHRRWPAMRLDRGLEVGSRGGHGPIRYAVSSLEPGRRVCFRFDPACGLAGTHRFEVVGAEGGCVLRHVIEARAVGPMRLLWPLAFRWLHDALLEDALDRAEVAAGISPTGPPWSPWVRLLRAGFQVWIQGQRRPTRPSIMRQE